MASRSRCWRRSRICITCARWVPECFGCWAFGGQLKTFTHTYHTYIYIYYASREMVSVCQPFPCWWLSKPGFLLVILGRVSAIFSLLDELVKGSALVYLQGFKAKMEPRTRNFCKLGSWRWWSRLPKHPLWLGDSFRKGSKGNQCLRCQYVNTNFKIC